MPFRLKNVLSTFQRTMDVISAAVKWEFGLVYLDGIVIYYKSAGKQSVMFVEF